MKKITPQSITGQQGANLIERIVLQMRYVWRPLVIFDVGIDGDIEICDPVTGEATNAFVKVQAKATTQPFAAETFDSFEYICEQKDLDYWLRGNAPTILIVCRPASDEAYWVSIKDYFKDLAVLKTRKIRFDKQRDRFDVTSAEALKQLALPRDSGVYFSPLAKPEILYTNLLGVASFAPQVHVAYTDIRRPEDVWAKFKSMGVRGTTEWVLTEKKIITFHDLAEYPFDSICDPGTHETFDTREWADSDDQDKRREFVRLLNSCLRERSRLLGLNHYNDRGQEYYYFPANRSLATRRVEYQSIQRRASREVFKQYGKKSDKSQIAYCRHLAFKGNFTRLEGNWYLEITPTYHFTRNGRDADKFGEERLKGIKRLERNPAVVGQLLMWVDYLKRPIATLFSAEYPFLSFGDLATVDIDIGVPDDVWYQTEEGNDLQTLSAAENQLLLSGL